MFPNEYNINTRPVDFFVEFSKPINVLCFNEYLQFHKL